jgi:hypothetical protein
MSRLASIALVLSACGSDRSFSSSDPVPTLTTSEQVELCEDFLDDICSGPLASFCDDPCINTGCAPAADMGSIDTECDGVSVGMVDDCASAGTFEVCAAGGGCMFDALEAICP